MLERASSLNRKLLGVVLLTTLVALVVALGAMITYDIRYYHRSWLADISTQAELLGKASASALLFDDPRVASENLGLLRYRPKVKAAAIYDARGAVFASYVAPQSVGAIPPLPGPDGARVEGSDLIVFERIVHDGQILGAVFLRAQYELVDRFLSYLGIAAVVAALAMGVAYLLSARLQRIVTEPILHIVGVARHVVTQGDYSRRAPKLSNDEVGVLTESFNAMLAEVERRDAELKSSNERLASEVAERKQAEEEILRLNVELEERVRQRTAQFEVANQELEAFCYSVSHDLRAPLRGIHGFSQALVQEFPADLSAAAHHFLSRILASAERMEQLIEDLLNLSRVSRGELARRRVDLGDLARQIVGTLLSVDPARQVEVSIWDGMIAEADPRLIRTALENLLGNAWKFTSKTDHARIEVGSLREAGRQVFYVRDNGAGFDMTYADKLFGAFQRLHRVTDFPGTGIGLATVERIIHRHGGKIWADAQENLGAAFYFTLAREVGDASTGSAATGANL